VIWSSEPLPSRQPFDAALAHLERLSPLAHPRLLRALALYCGLMDVAGVALFDVGMADLQRPAPLGAFMALQRLHLETQMELLHCDWAMKVMAPPAGLA